MTRLEYNNTLRDLFGLRTDLFMFSERLPIDKAYFRLEDGRMGDRLVISTREFGAKYPVLLPSASLPPDNRAEHGYRNRGDAMNVSPATLEHYVDLARAIVRSPKLADQSETFRRLVADPDAGEVPTPARSGYDAQAVATVAPNRNVKAGAEGGHVTVGPPGKRCSQRIPGGGRGRLRRRTARSESSAAAMPSSSRSAATCRRS